MTGRIRNLTIWLSSAACLLGLAGFSAQAADLGGDCCADLEERVAELEASTVRVGNRKMSISLYGQIDSGVLWYDNGEESDAYVVDVDTSTSRIGATGTGTVRKGLDIGYKLEIGAAFNPLSGVAENDNDNNTNIETRYAEIWLTSETLGTVYLGEGDPSSDSVIDGIDLSGPASWISYNGDADWTFSFSVVGAGPCDYAGGGSCWGFMSSFDTSRATRIRYDTPDMEGFTASASWGEDDQWDVAARYAKDFGTLSLSSAIGYYWSNDEQRPDGHYAVWGGSVSLYESTSGLYAVGSYADYDEQDAGLDTADAKQWYVKAGHRSNWTGIGETSIYGEYGETDVSTPRGAFFSNFGSIENNSVLANTLGDNVTSADGTMWGIGIGQDIDAMGATAYLGYRHLSADIDEGPLALSTKDIDAVLGGMVVPF